MSNSLKVPITFRNSRYSPCLSSFRLVGSAKFTLVIGVARKSRAETAGHIDYEARFAFATLDREAYTKLWNTIWASSDGDILLSVGERGCITHVNYQPHEKSAAIPAPAVTPTDAERANCS